MSTSTTPPTPLSTRLAVVVAYVVMILSNYLSTATTVFGGTNNAIISKENPTTLSPDGLTFAIWGIIYLFETILVVYQFVPRTASESVLDGTTRHWLIAAFLFNAIWLPIFSFHRWWLALAVIVGYLLALYQTSVAMAINYGDRKVPAHSQVCAMAGISLNMAWVVVATLLNFTIVSRNSNIITTVVTTNITNTTSGAVFPFEVATVGGNVDWAVLCIVLASSIAMYRAWQYADVAYCFVTAWALGGIYRMQTFSTDENYPTAGRSKDEATWALVFALLVGAAGVVAVGRAVYRAFTTVAPTGDEASLTTRLSGGSKAAPQNYV